MDIAHSPTVKYLRFHGVVLYSLFVLDGLKICYVFLNADTLLPYEGPGRTQRTMEMSLWFLTSVRKN